jgi:hypothetical protein
MMHINAMDNYLKHNPAPPPVIYRVKDLPPAPKKAPATPKKTIKEVPPANMQFTISLKPLSNICITNTDPKALLKPLPLR